ncbi:hypothetical protein EV426DRAFT_577355 [Tirmania nivea]|nr:hypothetical protein EV426DRAFT_577355 [Tirmania nivea]
MHDLDRRFNRDEDLIVGLDVDRVNEVFCVTWVDFVGVGSQSSRSITSAFLANAAARERERVNDGDEEEMEEDDGDGDGDDGEGGDDDGEGGGDAVVVVVVLLVFLVRGAGAEAVPTYQYPVGCCWSLPGGVESVFSIVCSRNRQINVERESVLSCFNWVGGLFERVGKLVPLGTRSGRAHEREIRAAEIAEGDRARQQLVRLVENSREQENRVLSLDSGSGSDDAEVATLGARTPRNGCPAGDASREVEV